MQNRAAVLPVSITSDAGELIRHQPHKFTQYWPFQCLSCGSSLAGQSDHTDLVPPEVGIVDKQAMVEDWLNPESEGEFAPQVQHYKPGQAGGSNCDCPPPPGISPQQKISKVSQISYPDLTWPDLLYRLLTSSTCVVEVQSGPVPGLHRVEGDPPPYPAELARGSPETPIARGAWWASRPARECFWSTTFSGCQRDRQDNAMQETKSWPDQLGWHQLENFIENCFSFPTCSSVN